AGQRDLQLVDPRLGTAGHAVGTADAGSAAFEDGLPAHPCAQELTLAQRRVEGLQARRLRLAEDPPRDRDVVDRAAWQLDVDPDLALARDRDQRRVAGVREVEAQPFGSLVRRAGGGVTRARAAPRGRATLLAACQRRLAVGSRREAQRARVGVQVGAQQRAQDPACRPPACTVRGTHEARRARPLLLRQELLEGRLACGAVHQVGEPHVDRFGCERRLRRAGSPLDLRHGADASVPAMATPAAAAGPAGSAAPVRVPPRELAAILLGTVLNPVNSSMIAVALVRIRADFDVSVVALSWLVSSFYLVTAVGQSVLGRLADQLGPRRIQCAGFALIVLAGVLGPLAPSFGWLIGARLLLAAGTAAGFPAGLALLRTASGGRPPAPRTLAAITIAGSTSAALGPALGGALVALAGWQAIFFVNVGLGVVALPLSLRWLPRDPQHARGLR